MITAEVWAKIVEASPYLAFVLLYIYFSAKQEDKRIDNVKCGSGHGRIPRMVQSSPRARLL